MANIKTNIANKATPAPKPSRSVKPPAHIEDDKTETVNAGPVSSIANAEPTFKRNMTGKKEIFTDLFKLMVSKVIKYEGWDEANEHPESHPNKFSTWEHTHPFRTFDKKGDKMNTCTPIGGHFHVIEWEENSNPDSPPRIKSVSGPMVMQKQRIKGVFKMAPVPANEFDDHTHDVEYLRSSKIEFSTTNIEASRVVAFESSKTAPLQGVQER
jgi:hypothetical protein